MVWLGLTVAYLVGANEYQHYMSSTRTRRMWTHWDFFSVILNKVNIWYTTFDMFSPVKSKWYKTESKNRI